MYLNNAQQLHATSHHPWMCSTLMRQLALCYCRQMSRCSRCTKTGFQNSFPVTRGLLIALHVPNWPNIPIKNYHHDEDVGILSVEALNMHTC